MKWIRLCVTTVAVAVSTVVLAQAPGSQAVDGAQKKQTVEDLSTVLNESYVFPEVAAKTAEFLQKQLASRAYDKANDAAAFARALTADLQAVAKDRHLRVGVRPPGEKPGADDSPEARERQRRELRRTNFGFEKGKVTKVVLTYDDGQRDEDMRSK